MDKKKNESKILFIIDIIFSLILSMGTYNYIYILRHDYC